MGLKRVGRERKRRKREGREREGKGTGEKSEGPSHFSFKFTTICRNCLSRTRVTNYRLFTRAFDTPALLYESTGSFAVCI